jgi:hypothetical protein
MLCASWADEHRPSTFVILINFSNLAVSKQKLRPSERQEHRIPNLRKAPDVGGNAKMDKTLKLLDSETLCLLDNNDNIIARCKPRWTNFIQFKRIKENCNIIQEDDENIIIDHTGKANIYCLDDQFNVKWTIDAPRENDTFPNPIIWNKETTRRWGENGFLTIGVTDNSETFICASWNCYTVTVDYETGKIIKEEFTK